MALARLVPAYADLRHMEELVARYEHVLRDDGVRAGALHAHHVPGGVDSVLLAAQVGKAAVLERSVRLADSHAKLRPAGMSRSRGIGPAPVDDISAFDLVERARRVGDAADHRVFSGGTEDRFLQSVGAKAGDPCGAVQHGVDPADRRIALGQFEPDQRHRTRAGASAAPAARRCHRPEPGIAQRAEHIGMEQAVFVAVTCLGQQHRLQRARLGDQGLFGIQIVAGHGQARRSLRFGCFFQDRGHRRALSISFMTF